MGLNNEPLDLNQTIPGVSVGQTADLYARHDYDCAKICSSSGLLTTEPW